MTRDTGPTYPDGSPIEPQDMEALTEYAKDYRKAELIPVHVQQREDAALGAAWRRCEAALPEGWEMDRLIQKWGERAAIGWWAGANRGNGSLEWAKGPTPTAALEALADKLEAGHG